MLSLLIMIVCFIFIPSSLCNFDKLHKSLEFVLQIEKIFLLCSYIHEVYNFLNIYNLEYTFYYQSYIGWILVYTKEFVYMPWMDLHAWTFSCLKTENFFLWISKILCIHDFSWFTIIIWNSEQLQNEIYVPDYFISVILKFFIGTFRQIKHKFL